jgi:acyl-CoA synthetase (NDP forming)
MSAPDPDRSGAALVGASESSFWMRWALRNLRGYGYPGEIWPVNPRYAEVFGLPAYPSVGDLPGVPRHVIMAISAPRCPAVVRQAVAMGAEHISVVADGFAERQDATGIALQAELVAACAGAPVTLYGPNGVGFADLAAGVCLIAEPVPRDLQAGSVSYISQSGALVSAGLSAIREEGLGVDWCVSLGNAARLDLPVAIDICVRRPGTQVICLYLESLGLRIEELARALESARRAGKRVIMVKAGRSAKARKAALTHTASIAGDDRLVDAFLSRHGVIRVESIEEMARTATLAALVPGVPDGAGIVVMGSSGGVAGLSSDLAVQHGVQLTRLAAPTRDRVREMASAAAFTENPFDLAGLPSSRATTEDIYDCVASDPGVTLMVYPFSVVLPDEVPENEMHRETIRMLARVTQRTGTPIIVPTLALTAWTPWITQHRHDEPKLAIVQGLGLTFSALRHLYPARAASSGAPENADATGGADSPPPEGAALDEADSRERLQQAGIAVVPGRLCRSPADLPAAVSELRAPYAVKLLAAGVTHRAKAGGVRLGCGSLAEVEAAWQSILADARAHGVADADVRGVMVEEMASGAEVIIGLSRDPVFGPVLTVGHGGVDVAAKAATVVGLLPLRPGELPAILAGLGIDRLSPGHELGPLVGLIDQLVDAFVTGPLRETVTVETNPVILDPAGPVIADVLIVEPLPAAQLAERQTA